MTALLDSTIADRARSEIESIGAYLTAFPMPQEGQPDMVTAWAHAHADGVRDAASKLLEQHYDEDTILRLATKAESQAMTGDETQDTYFQAVALELRYCLTGRGTPPSEGF